MSSKEVPVVRLAGNRFVVFSGDEEEPLCVYMNDMEMFPAFDLGVDWLSAHVAAIVALHAAGQDWSRAWNSCRDGIRRYTDDVSLHMLGAVNCLGRRLDEIDYMRGGAAPRESTDMIREGLTWKFDQDGALRSTTGGWVIETVGSGAEVTLRRRGMYREVFSDTRRAMRNAEETSRICAEWKRSRAALDFDCPTTGRHWQYTRKGWWICKGTSWRITGDGREVDGIAVYEGKVRHYLAGAMSPQSGSRYLAELEEVREENLVVVGSGGDCDSPGVSLPGFRVKWFNRGWDAELRIRELGVRVGKVSQEGGRFVSFVPGIDSRPMFWDSKKEAMAAVEWWVEQMLRATVVGRK